jgi:hypothetical protein
MQQLSECTVCGNGLGPLLWQVPGLTSRTGAEKVKATGVQQVCCRALIRTYNVHAAQLTVKLEHNTRKALARRRRPPISAQVLDCVG